eukprot:363302-Chlamydomonas_euryale.AAC.2
MHTHAAAAAAAAATTTLQQAGDDAARAVAAVPRAGIPAVADKTIAAAERNPQATRRHNPAAVLRIGLPPAGRGCGAAPCCS